MRTETITQEIHSYSDLLQNKELKAKVLGKHHYINVDDSFWHECITADFKEIAKIIGLDVSEIFFSGFCSQGDGACFEGLYRYRKNALNDLKAYAPQDKGLHEIAQELQKLQRKCFYQALINISHYGNYFHQNSMKYHFDSNDYFFESQVHILSEEFEEVFRNLANWLYNSLENQYNYLISDEAIMETIEANNYEFNANGEII